jgi:hypothetical protein
MSRISRRIAARIARLEKEVNAIGEEDEREPTFYDMFDFDENGHLFERPDFAERFPKHAKERAAEQASYDPYAIEREIREVEERAIARANATANCSEGSGASREVRRQGRGKPDSQ